MEMTGLDDFGEPTWREGLDHLVPALREEARLNDLGGRIAMGGIVELLANRLAITGWRAQHPEVAAGDVLPPIVIVGQARTGTTILFDLLAQDPATRAPLTWEIDRPVPPPESATFDTDPRIDEVDAILAGVDLLMPGFRTMHPMGARLAQECVSITNSDFRSVIFPTQYHVPSYGKWVMYEADMAPAYRWHRKFLQHLQSRHPAGDQPAPRWLVKSPAHIWSLDALVAEYPEAILVQTHRDPLRIIASVASLMVTLRGMTCDDPTLPEVADEWAEYIVEGLDRSVTARENGTVSPGRVVDVQFEDFMADPFATIGLIYDALGLELTKESETRMRSFLAAHGQGEHGAHTYSFTDTGLDLGEWRERTRRYQEYFDVPSDPRLP
ncbi:MAG: sulfotransferase family protein [Acidimicrobiia bacterium]